MRLKPSGSPDSGAERAVLHATSPVPDTAVAFASVHTILELYLRSEIGVRAVRCLIARTMAQIMAQHRYLTTDASRQKVESYKIGIYRLAPAARTRLCD